VNTKTPILGYFKTHWPDYPFVGERRPNLIFRKEAECGIYQMLSLQRDSKSNALSLNIGCTYNPAWEGETAEPLGRDAGLANLRLRSRAVEAIMHWHFYKPTCEGLVQTLDELKSQFEKLAPNFFQSSRKALLSNSLLQLALGKSSEYSLEELSGLQEGLKAVQYQVAEVTHPAYLDLRKTLEVTWTWRTSKEDRHWTNRIAYDCLSLRLAQIPS
jgi:hypothetical protein